MAHGERTYPDINSRKMTTINFKRTHDDRVNPYMSHLLGNIVRHRVDYRTIRPGTGRDRPRVIT